MCQGDPRADAWPSKGTIEFVDLSLRYRPGLPLALEGFSAVVEGGSTTGIVGRTGAGKSTLVLALLRLVEPAGGSVIVDGVHIEKLGLKTLRRVMTIIPQVRAHPVTTYPPSLPAPHHSLPPTPHPHFPTPPFPSGTGTLPTPRPPLLPPPPLPHPFSPPLLPTPPSGPGTSPGHRLAQPRSLRCHFGGRPARGACARAAAPLDARRPRLQGGLKPLVGREAAALLCSRSPRRRFGAHQPPL